MPSMLTLPSQAATLLATTPSPPVKPESLPLPSRVIAGSGDIPIRGTVITTKELGAAQATAATPATSQANKNTHFWVIDEFVLKNSAVSHGYANGKRTTTSASHGDLVANTLDGITGVSARRVQKGKTWSESVAKFRLIQAEEAKLQNTTRDKADLSNVVINFSQGIFSGTVSPEFIAVINELTARGARIYISQGNPSDRLSGSVVDGNVATVGGVNLFATLTGKPPGAVIPVTGSGAIIGDVADSSRDSFYDSNTGSITCNNTAPNVSACRQNWPSMASTSYNDIILIERDKKTGGLSAVANGATIPESDLVKNTATIEGRNLDGMKAKPVSAIEFKVFLDTFEKKLCNKFGVQKVSELSENNYALYLKAMRAQWIAKFGENTVISHETRWKDRIGTYMTLATAIAMQPFGTNEKEVFYDATEVLFGRSSKSQDFILPYSIDKSGRLKLGGTTGERMRGTSFSSPATAGLAESLANQRLKPRAIGRNYNGPRVVL